MIRHHPSEEMLMRHAAGGIEEPLAVALNAHLDACDACRREVALWERVGGALLEDIAPAEMSDTALDRALAAIANEQSRTQKDHSVARRVTQTASLPRALRSYRVGREFPIGPGIYKRNVWRDRRGSGRVFLLRGRPGLALPSHGHSGVELTYVVKGGYTDEHGHYEPGDFFTADASLHHSPRVDDDGECVLLIASTGRPQAPGWLGIFMRLFM
jgi:putative transcriptional regulator